MDRTITKPSSNSASKNTFPHLPTECIRTILSFIEDDIQTLRSILLLNRTWCKNTVPVLWKKPFNLSASSSLSLEKIIPIYLSYLPEDSFEIPEMQKIKQFIYKRSTIFDYASFLKELDYKKLYDVISEFVTANKILETKEEGEDLNLDLTRLSFRDSEAFIEDVQGLVDDNWGSHELDNSIIDTQEDDDYLDDEIVYSDDNNDDDFDDYDDYFEDEMDGQWSDPEYFHYETGNVEIPFEISVEKKKLIIVKSICMYLMNTCKNFEKLVLDTRGWTRSLSINSYEYISLPCFPGSIECLSNLTEFVLNGEFNKSEILDVMATCCKGIRSLMIIDTHISSSHSLAKLIRAQNGLKIFIWCSSGENSSQVLRSIVSQSESLTNFQLKNVYAKDFNAFEGLAACKNLESLKFSECQLTNLHMKALANAKFSRLKSIEISGIDDQDDECDPPSLELMSLIHNTNVHLQEIKINLELHFYPGLVETIANNCPNLITFSGNIYNDDQCAELRKLLIGCKKLVNLIIHGIYWCNLHPIDDMLPQLGHLIPESLKYLDLTKWTFSGSSLNQFLMTCKAKLKLMTWHCYYNAEAHKEAINAYAKERKIIVKDFNVEFYDGGYGWQRTICHVSVTFDECDVN